MTTSLSPAHGRDAGTQTERRPRPSISTTLLLPQDRIPREPLGLWARRLSAHLEASLADIRESAALARTVSGIANTAALIAISRGGKSGAWDLCSGQIRWLWRLSRRSGSAPVAVYAVQPWVNLGRLEAISGRCDEAAARFERLMESDAAGALNLECFKVAADAWDGVPETRGAGQSHLLLVYVLDTLRALLINRRHEELLRFADRVEARFGDAMRSRLTEGAVVASSLLGDHARAEALARSGSRGSSGWNRFAFQLRLAEALACGGDREGAEAVLRRLGMLVLGLSAGAKAELQNLYVLCRLAGACRELGLDDLAAAVARDALEGARAAGDEVFQIEGLRILADVSPFPERLQWEAALGTLEGETEYARYRTPGKPLPANPDVDRLCARLMDVFSS
jgi:hypothetical protein